MDKETKDAIETMAQRCTTAVADFVGGPYTRFVDLVRTQMLALAEAHNKQGAQTNDAMNQLLQRVQALEKHAGIESPSVTPMKTEQ